MSFKYKCDPNLSSVLLKLLFSATANMAILGPIFAWWNSKNEGISNETISWNNPA